MKLLIIISLAFITSCAWVEKPAVTKAIILCAGNEGLKKLKLAYTGSFSGSSVIILCENGARFKILNEKVYTKLEGL